MGIDRPLFFRRACLNHQDHRFVAISSEVRHVHFHDTKVMTFQHVVNAREIFDEARLVVDARARFHVGPDFGKESLVKRIARAGIV